MADDSIHADMDTLAQVLVGLGVVGLGAVSLAFGLLGEEDAVFRHVDEVLADPAAHSHGEFTVMGTPIQGNTSTRVVLWRDGDALRESTLRTSVTPPGEDGVSRWRFENETRTAGRAAGEDTHTLDVREWTVAGPHAVFLIRGFAQAEESPPEMWAIYREVLPEPLQPKPSQFTGGFWTQLPDGESLPEDALVWQVRTYTVGCSSKFMPDAETSSEVAPP